ncbi:MAG: DUF5667 domain-containing protein [Chloroflexota bacterium]
MSKSLDTILAECTQAVRSGEMTVEQCLQRFPEHASEITLVLNAWQILDSAPRVAPSPAFVRTSKSRLLNRLSDRKSSSPLAGFRTALQTIMSAFIPKASTMRWVTIAVIALFAVLSTGAGAAYASEGALPGDTLYSTKTTIEEVRLAFADSEGDVELFNEFANTRVAEMQTLAAAGRSEGIPTAAEGYENAVNGMAQALAEVAKDDEARAAALADLLAAAHEIRTSVLNDLLSKVPEQGQKGIQRALEAGGPPEGKGKPDDKGKPENPGCPENAGGQSGEHGKPEDAGGPPEGKGQPDDKGKPEDAGGPPEDGGKPDDAGQPDRCATESDPALEGGEGDEGEVDSD